MCFLLLLLLLDHVRLPIIAIISTMICAYALFGFTYNINHGVDAVQLYDTEHYYGQQMKYISEKKSVYIYCIFATCIVGIITLIVDAVTMSFFGAKGRGRIQAFFVPCVIVSLNNVMAKARDGIKGSDQIKRKTQLCNIQIKSN